MPYSDISIVRIREKNSKKKIDNFIKKMKEEYEKKIKKYEASVLEKNRLYYQKHNIDINTLENDIESETNIEAILPEISVDNMIFHEVTEVTEVTRGPTLEKQERRKKERLENKIEKITDEVNGVLLRNKDLTDEVLERMITVDDLACSVFKAVYIDTGRIKRHCIEEYEVDKGLVHNIKTSIRNIILKDMIYIFKKIVLISQNTKAVAVSNKYLDFIRGGCVVKDMIKKMVKLIKYTEDVLVKVSYYNHFVETMVVKTGDVKDTINETNLLKAWFMYKDLYNTEIPHDINHMKIAVGDFTKGVTRGCKFSVIARDLRSIKIKYGVRV
jgi:hypothetical protein